MIFAIIMVLFLLGAFSPWILEYLIDKDGFFHPDLEGKMIRHRLDHSKVGLVIRHYHNIKTVHVKFSPYQEACWSDNEVELIPDDINK